MTNVLPMKDGHADSDAKADTAIENFNKLFANWLRARARVSDPWAPSDPKANDEHYEKLDGRLNHSHLGTRQNTGRNSLSGPRKVRGFAEPHHKRRRSAKQSGLANGRQHPGRYVRVDVVTGISADLASPVSGGNFDQQGWLVL